MKTTISECSKEASEEQEEQQGQVQDGASEHQESTLQGNRAPVAGDQLKSDRLCSMSFLLFYPTHFSPVVGNYFKVKLFRVIMVLLGKFHFILLRQSSSIFTSLGK